MPDEQTNRSGSALQDRAREVFALTSEILPDGTWLTGHVQVKASDIIAAMIAFRLEAQEPLTEALERFLSNNSVARGLPDAAKAARTAIAYARAGA